MDLQTVLALEASEALQWLTNGADNVDASFNWLGLAQGTVKRVYTHAKSGDVSSADAWAELAVRIYEKRLARDIEKIDDADVQSSMMLRCWMIARLGDDAGHPVRDLTLVQSWFLHGVSLSLEQAQRTAEALRAIPAEGWPQHIALVQQLRGIKNALRVFANPELSLLPELRHWLALRPLLP